jgi:hypothetical protein
LEQEANAELEAELERQGAGDLRAPTAIETTLAMGLAPQPKRLAERVASAKEEAAIEDEDAEATAEAEPKALSPA